jgi:plastocyanin
VFTINITNAGVSPANVVLAIGSRVRFVNQSTTGHQMSSDPHPVHTDCPPINQVPFLGPGQSGQTGTFPNARTCGFHDHLDPFNVTLQGSIIVLP